MFDTSYTFNDITLIPQYSEILSRIDTDLSTRLSKDIYVNIPLIPANMDTVISEELGEIMLKNGSIPIFHRFCSIDEQKEFISKMNGQCFISSGVKNYDLEVCRELLDFGAVGVCFDIAHGHCKMMIDAIKSIKLTHPNKQVIAGNICTPEGYIDLCNAGADAVKAGIGGGSICTTRMVTGHGLPMFSTIYNIGKIKRGYDIPLIADGGITHIRDVVLCLACGADSVMMGNLFSKTYESAGEKFIKDGKYVKVYRGQASKEFQTDFYGKLKPGTAPEGISGFVECNRNAQEMIDEFCGGIRSALTYSGVQDIKSLYNKAKFSVAHSSSFIIESNTRI